MYVNIVTKTAQEWAFRVKSERYVFKMCEEETFCVLIYCLKYSITALNSNLFSLYFVALLQYVSLVTSVKTFFGSKTVSDSLFENVSHNNVSSLIYPIRYIVLPIVLIIS